MLTVKQPPTYGYKSVHDLPTPPSTSRPSPPLIYRESANNSLPVAYRGHSPPSQPMSAPHRGLPPPAAMTLPPQQPPAAGAPPSAHLPPHPPPPPPPQPSLGPPGHQQRDSWDQLPAPPQQWQGAEESMRHWLQARAEEDKRKQEEERTRQESLRLEQRKVEMDMLRTSLQAGIPPPMVPLVFAGMGGGGVAPQAALEWAQQFMPPGQAPPRAQIMPAQWPVSPEHQRESQTQSHTHAQHPGIPSASTPAAGYVYPPSPSRPRGQTVSGAIGRPMGMSTLPSLNTNVPQSAHAPPPMHSHQHPHMQQEPQSSPSIYFHHWQPPTSQASGSSNRPGSPSESAKQQGIMLLPPPARFVDHDVVIHDKEVTCHPSESPGQDALAGRVLADLYAECLRYAAQRLCPRKNDRVVRRSSQYRLCCQRSHRPAHGIQGHLARAKSEKIATGSHLLEIQSHIGALRKLQNREIIQGRDKALDGSAP
ncbi:uncharacterized protein BKA55DRAFT_594268 [Fusarium redolens]|uniref:Uncharacterized protein n=1 Tax=Fusarium redolens TaxID=48865 RepID=A0A9P9H315_FUSRE|nr:uncharacterized protein BKA55DRAFT_594268 [Fusarium redolens]KAH7250111.1 hypothetical protein BKA55DRAFT_594268 [Fusarium redolens]